MKYLLAAYTLLILAAITEGEEWKSPTFHKSFNRRELAETFGCNHHADVPKYQSTKIHGLRMLEDNDRGSPLTVRLKAFGDNFKIHLSLNKDLVADTHTVEFVGKDGNVTKYRGIHGQFSSGYVDDDPDSYVAFHHTGKGVSGSIRTFKDFYIVNSLPHRLKNEQNDHIIYRGSDMDGEHYVKKYMKEVQDNQQSHRLRKRRGLPTFPKKTAEILIAADYRMLEFFNKDRLPSYLLAVANIMAGFFKDPSLNYPLNLVVVRTAIFETNLFGAANVGQLLAAFYAWGLKNNDMDDNSVNHYDIGVLITKNGCADGCGVEGLAYAGVTCSMRAVGLGKDRGLMSAITLSHEVGHTLSAPHDGESIECTDGLYIMATGGVAGGMQAMQWSTCASKGIEATLKSSASKCFDDTPKKNLGDGRFQLYGTVYNQSVQCDFIYGPMYQMCWPYRHRCDALFCQHKERTTTCETIFFPPVHGTQCGDYKWCVDAACVPNGKLPPPKIHGQWSVWGAYEPCTKECDIGVQWRVRHCNNPAPSNGGEWCSKAVRQVPELSHYRTCNKHKCEKTTEATDIHLTERNAQCKKRSSTYIFCRTCGDMSPCELVCGTVYWSGVLIGWVKSGTHCRNYAVGIARGVCAHGVCKEIGCDNNLNSGMAIDRCGICGGDGSSCRHVVGKNPDNFYAHDRFGQWYLYTIPAQSFKVLYSEVGRTFNFISVKIGSKNGGYAIGPFTRYKQIKMDGATLTYKMTAFPNQDQVTIVGFTKVPVYLYYINMYYRQPGSGFYWDYFTNSSEIKNEYKWVAEKFTKCSRECAGGTKTRRVYCTRKDDNTRANDAGCNKMKLAKPIKEVPCNEQNCGAVWYISPYTLCTRSCGNGTKSRKIFCGELTKYPKITANYLEVKDSKCTYKTKPPYPTTIYCNSIDCHAQWEVASPFTACSKSCEGGVYSRKVLCKRLDKSGKKIKVSKMECSTAKNIKPVEKESCNQDIPCPKWKISYSSCSVTCGNGVLQPNIDCVKGGSENKHLDFSKCDSTTKPKTSSITMKDCNLGNCAGYEWGFKDGACSVSCGHGIITATIICYDKQTKRAYPDYRCDKTKPAVPTPKKCNRGVCEEIFYWKNDKYSGCSKTCGIGVRNSKAYCIRQSDNESVTNIFCDGATKPAVVSKSCKLRSCPLHDWVYNYGFCSVTCGTGIRWGTPVCKTIKDSSIVNDKYCASEKAKPSNDNKTCVHNACPDPSMYKWELKNLTCTVTCGGGVISTENVCFRMDSEIKYTRVNPTNCDKRKEPNPKVVKCNTHICPATHKWNVTGDYCAVGCGRGYNAFVMKCVEIKTNQFVSIKDCANDSSAKYTCNVPCKPANRDKANPIYPIGCYSVNSKDRRIPTYFADYTSEASKGNMIKNCWKGALSKNANFFALGNLGHCYIAKDYEVKVDKFVRIAINHCPGGVGKAGANYIFHIGTPIAKVNLPPIVKLGCRRMGSTTNGNYPGGDDSSSLTPSIITKCGVEAYKSDNGVEYFGGNSKGNCLTKTAVATSLKSGLIEETCFAELKDQTQYHIYKFRRS